MKFQLLVLFIWIITGILSSHDGAEIDMYLSKLTKFSTLGTCSTSNLFQSYPITIGCDSELIQEGIHRYEPTRLCRLFHVWILDNSIVMDPHKSQLGISSKALVGSFYKYENTIESKSSNKTSYTIKNLEKTNKKLCAVDHIPFHINKGAYSNKKSLPIIHALKHEI